MATMGALTQAPMHSISPSVNMPSFVVSPTWMPRWLVRAASIFSAPFSLRVCVQQVGGQRSLDLLGAVQPACVCTTGGRSAQPPSSRRRSARVCVCNSWEVSAASIFSTPFSLCVRDTQSSLACVKMASTDTLSRHRSACWMWRMCLTGRSASPSHTWAPPTTTQDTHLHGVVPQIMTWNLPILVLLNML